MNKNKTKRIRLFDKKFLHKCMDPNYYDKAEKLYKVKERLLKLSKKYNRQDIWLNLKNDLLSRSLLILSARKLLIGSKK